MKKDTPKKVFERIYIYAGTVNTAEGWILVIHAMDALSEFVFEPVFNRKPVLTVDVLNELFDNALKDYNPIFHPRIINFVTNIPDEYNSLLKQTKAARHQFTFNKEATANAMHEFLSGLKYETVAL